MKIVFGEVRDKVEIIQKSVFNKVRHPMYLGAILLYLGLIVLTLSISSFGLWIIIFIFYNQIAKYEEGLLLNHFGEDYKDYMKKAGRWLPK